MTLEEFQRGIRHHIRVATHQTKASVKKVLKSFAINLMCMIVSLLVRDMRTPLVHTRALALLALLSFPRCAAPTRSLTRGSAPLLPPRVRPASPSLALPPPHTHLCAPSPPRSIQGVVSTSLVFEDIAQSNVKDQADNLLLSAASLALYESAVALKETEQLARSMAGVWARGSFGPWGGGGEGGEGGMQQPEFRQHVLQMMDTIGAQGIWMGTLDGGLVGACRSTPGGPVTFLRRDGDTSPGQCKVKVIASLEAPTLAHTAHICVPPVCLP